MSAPSRVVTSSPKEILATEKVIHSAIVMKFDGPWTRTGALQLANAANFVAQLLGGTVSLVAAIPYRKNGVSK